MKLKINNKRSEKQEEEKGITLVALVVTIIILLILAGVAVRSITGENGLIRQTKGAAFKHELASIKESQTLSSALNNLNNVGSGTINQLPIYVQIEGKYTRIEKCTEGSSFIETIKGSYNEIHSMLERIKYLLEEYSEYTENEQSFLQEEITMLINLINEGSDKSNFNGIKLLNQNRNAVIYYETNEYISIELKDMSAKGFNIDNIDFNNASKIEEAKQNVENAITLVENLRNDLDNKKSFLEDKVKDIEKEIEELEQYRNLDVYPSKEAQNGELESEKISKIDTVLQNVQNAIEIAMEKDEKLKELLFLIYRIKELTMMASNETSDNSAEIAEINETIQQINNIANTTGNYNENFAIGLDGETVNITIGQIDSEHLGENEGPIYINFDNSQNFEKSLQSIEFANDKIGNYRAKLGSMQNCLEKTINYYEDIKDVLNNRYENEEEKNSELALVGIDVIQEILTMARELIIRSSTDCINEIDREYYYIEAETYLQELERISNHTKNKTGINLLNGEWRQDINLTLTNLMLNNINTDTSQNANASVQRLEESILKTVEMQKKLRNNENSETTNEYKLEGKWKDKLKIVNGKLIFIGTDETERRWAQEIGISVE